MKKLFAIFTVLLFFSCTPRISYLGESYGPTSNVDVFYDEGDIQRDYTVMGLISADTVDRLPQSTEKIRDAMIQKAKDQGADAIILLNFAALGGGNDMDQYVVEGKLLKYK